MRPYRALPRAVTTFAALALLAGCASPAAETAAVKETKPAASSSTSTPAKPTKAPTVQELTIKKVRVESGKKLKADGVKISSETRKNKHGGFPVLEIQPGAPIAKFKPSLVKKKFPHIEYAVETTPGLPPGWTNEEAGEAQLFAAQVLMDTIYNAPSNGDDSSGWRTKMLMKKVSTQRLVELLEPYEGEYGMPVFGNKNAAALHFTDKKKTKLISIHDGKTPRIGDFNILPEAVANADGNLAFHFGGDLWWNGTSKDEKQGIAAIYDLKTTISVAKSGDGFLMDAWAGHNDVKDKGWRYTD